MLEKTVEKELCDRIKNDLGGWALKFVSPGQNGVPDRIVLVPYGRIYFVETRHRVKSCVSCKNMFAV